MPLTHPPPSLQIPIQENNQRVVQRIIDEIANLQKLKHTNIIRYYGVEVHRVCACVCMCVCACVRACVCVCMHACMRACVRACVRVCVQGMSVP